MRLVESGFIRLAMRRWIPLPSEARRLLDQPQQSGGEVREGGEEGELEGRVGRGAFL